MRHSKQGSALLSALIFGAIILFALAALLGTALTEYRGAARATANSTAFFLAEAGVDRATPVALADAFEASGTKWTRVEANKYTRVFAADPDSLGNMSGRYEVVAVKSSGATDTTFTLYSKGTAINTGGQITSSRAVKAVFSLENELVDGAGDGCVSRSTWMGGSTGNSNISATQIGPSFDAYSSRFNNGKNTAPSWLNRTNKCTIGTQSAEDGALNLVNGQYYCTVGTGSSTTNPYPDVDFATANAVSLATIDKAATAVEDQTVYDGTTDSEYLLRRDVTVDTPSVVPDAVSAANGWTIVMPGTGTENSQWRNGGKISQFSDNDNATAANATSTVSYGANVLTMGTSNSDKIYATTESLDSISRIDVSGTVVLVVNGQINSNGLTINYKTADAKLTIYTNGQVSGVVRSTQQLDGTTAAVQNWEADRLAIKVVPSSTDLSGKSWRQYTDDNGASGWRISTPEDIHKAASTAVTGAGTNTTGGNSVEMNFSDSDVFVGQIHAPYSYVKLSATGSDRGWSEGRKMSDYCGALIAGSLAVMGSNGFAFHFDQALGGGSTENPKLSLTRWEQISPDNSVFD